MYLPSKPFGTIYISMNAMWYVYVSMSCAFVSECVCTVQMNEYISLLQSFLEHEINYFFPEFLPI